MEVPVAHRASAAVVERRGGAGDHRQIHAAACAPTRRGARSNIEFIRRINGSTRVEDVKRIVFDATYLVLGLGDVYLGAPVATPIDPRHRLVTTKYNPARTWTPDNVVGIGGAYLCVYGMEGPGGYQLFGRTCQMWNTYRTTDGVRAGQAVAAALLRPDPVLSGVGRRAARRSATAFLEGKREIEIVPTTVQRSKTISPSSTATPRASLPSRRGSRRRSTPSGRAGKRRDAGGNGATGEMPDDAETDAVLPPGATAVESPVPGSVWKILVEPGHKVSEGETLIIVESMKMEIAVCAPSSGLVREIRCTEGRPVQLGQALVIMADTGP